MELGSTGIEEEEDGIKAYFTEDPELLEQVENELTEAGLGYRRERIEDRDWNELWESSFSPLEIGRKLLVRAPFHENAEGYEHRIEISPKRAFGTGHHATTHLMLERLLSLPLEEKRVLDMGCGTAILSILCEQRGATEILAIDNETWAVQNAKEQVEANDAERVRVERGERIPLKDGRFDVILGNIEKRALLGMIPDMVQVLSAKGRILLSGLRPGDLSDIHRECASLGLSKVTEKERDEWIILEYRTAE